MADADTEHGEIERSTLRSRSERELDHPDSLWNRAAAQTEQADPFCCRTEWQLSFHEVLAPGRDLLLREYGDSLLAFARNRRSPAGAVLEPIDCGWRFASPLLGPRAVEALDALVEEFADAGERVAIVISGLVPRSETVQQLQRTFRGRYLYSTIERSVLSHASLDGGVDGYLSRRTGHFRRNLRAAERRAQGRGVTFERHAPRSADEAATVYERMLRIERASWKGIGRCGMTEPGARQFYGAMMRRLAQNGMGRVMFATCGGIDVGFIFGGLAGAHYRGQQFSYIEEWSSMSIGNLLQLAQIRWLVEEGVQRYDMGPRMDYKPQWTELETTIETRLLRPKPTAPARILPGPRPTR